MRSVYVIGGAGSGKSTFAADVLTHLGVDPGETVELYRGPGGGKDAFRQRRIRGHLLKAGGDTRGTYVGVLRPEFPGTDGLDKVILPVAVRWVTNEPIPGSYLLAEGLRLGNVEFLSTLAAQSELHVFHLTVDPIVADLRYAARKSTQPDQFIHASRTRAAKLAVDLRAAGIRVEDYDTTDLTHWDERTQRAARYLNGES